MPVRTRHEPRLSSEALGSTKWDTSPPKPKFHASPVFESASPRTKPSTSRAAKFTVISIVPW